MIRAIASTIAGVAVAIALISVNEMLIHRIWTIPEGMDSGDPQRLREAMALMPLGALVGVALGWLLGAFGGGLLAAWFSRRTVPAYVVGGLIALSGVTNLVMLPHPLWFWMVALVLVPVAALLAARLGTRPKLQAA